MRLLWGVACAMTLVGGCASEGNPDPNEGTNRAIYKFNDAVDRAVLRPVSQAYAKVIPHPVQSGIGNAFRNLKYINVILNDFLQQNWDQGWSDTGRMAVNSTVGLLGVIDVATNWGMPAHENDIGITLGRWGVGSGAYLVLPLLGPSSGRDVPDVPVSIVTNPLFWINIPWEATAGLTAVDVVDRRARAEPVFKLREQAAIDPYVFTRDAYLQYRQAQITGATTRPATEPGLYDEEEDTGPMPTTQAATGSTTQPGTRPATVPVTGPATMP